MAIRISKQNDAMVLQQIAGIHLSSANADAFLVAIKAFLDANFASYKDGSGNYTVPHVRQAVLTLMNRGK